MKIIKAIEQGPGMDEEEVDNFLQRKLNLQLATVDENGDPNIQPVWFNYDKENRKLNIMTPKASKKIKNIRNSQNIYFSVDDEEFPSKGVKGQRVR
jgi:nitroimidazol reductase NimA-like FMN-containing flavoprotein (pyridoxamine 5'-phosphate oxidase superfamily)